MYSELRYENYQSLHDAARLAARELRTQAIRAFRQRTGRAAVRLLQALRRPAALQFPREA